VWETGHNGESDVEFLLLIVGLVGVLWGGILFVRGNLMWGALLVLLAGSCFGHPFFNLPAGPIPITSDRLLLLALAAQYIAFRRFGWAQPKPLDRVDYALVAFLGVLFASVVTHDFTINKYKPASGLLFYYLMPLALYWIVRQAKIAERDVWTVFACFTVFGLYLALTAIAEWKGYWGLVFPRYITSPTFVEFYGRGRGPFLNPAGLGIYLGVAVSCVLLLLPRLNRIAQLGMLMLVPVLLLGIYGTLTRSVWMAVGAGLMLVVGLNLPKHWRLPIGLCVLMLGATGVVLKSDSLLSFKRDKNLSASEANESAKLRPIFLYVAWQMFQDRPLFGAGFQHYRESVTPYLSDRSTELELEKVRPYIQHNVFLSQLTEIGVLGLGLFLITLGLWTRDAWQLWVNRDLPLWRRECGLLFLVMLANYVVNGMFHEVSVIPMVHMLLFFTAGLFESVRPRPHAARARAALPSANWRPAAGVHAPA
jgi:O-antigen ligase